MFCFLAIAYYDGSTISIRDRFHNDIDLTAEESARFVVELKACMEALIGMGWWTDELNQFTTVRKSKEEMEAEPQPARHRATSEGTTSDDAPSQNSAVARARAKREAARRARENGAAANNSTATDEATETNDAAKQAEDKGSNALNYFILITIIIFAIFLIGVFCAITFS